MSKAISMIGAGAALLLGFLFACAVIGFALLSGSQADVGYAPCEDVGADPIETDSGYDSDPTYITGEMTGIIVNNGGSNPPISFKRS